MKVSPVAGSLGSVVHDLNVLQMSADETAALRSLLASRHVLFFPRQEASPEVLQRFAESMGPVRSITHDGPPPFLESPHISVLNSELRADRWHTDLTYLDAPNAATVLLYIEGPEGAGDTMWASTQAAYRALSPRMQHYLDGLRAVHTAANNGNPELQSVHPVVLKHPQTGKLSLYVNRHYTSHIEGIPTGESAAILSFLFRHMEQVSFTCRWQWSPGDLCIWDNRATLHIAVDDYAKETERILYRITTTDLK